MPNYQNKTKDELIKELQELHLECDSLKISYEKDITERKQVEETLKFTQMILDNAADTMTCIDYDGHYIDVNEALCRSVGYSREELLSMTVHDIDPNYPAGIWPEFMEKLKQTGSLTFESLHRTKEGKLIPVEVRVSFFEHNGKEYHSGFARDITERKQAEELLKESMERFNEAQKLAHIGVWDWKPDTDTVTWTDELYHIAGLDPMLPAPNYYNEHPNLYTPESWELLKTGVEKAMETGESYQFELELIRPNGDTRYVNAFGGAKFDSKGQVNGLFGTVQDITERKQTEETLHLEKENFRHSLDDSPLGVRIATIEGNTIYANKKLLDFYGYDSLGELQTTPLKKRYTPESYAEAQKRMRQRKHGDLSTTDYEISIVRKNGEIHNLQVFRKKVLWNGIWQFQIIYNDITERRQAEEEIRKSKKLLEDLNRHLFEIRENERTLISREIHDEMGQSMTALKLDLNRMHKYVGTNPEAIMKLDSMIELVSNTIKDVQRISSDLRPGILDDLGLVSAIEWYCEEFEKRTEIKCSQELDNSVYNDSQINLTFFRVLQETLTNVIRHARASSVHVKLQKSTKGTTLIIQDDGIGISEEKIESHKSLGLISMSERVRQFNGNIDISSKKGDGTKLTIFIPS